MNRGVGPTSSYTGSPCSSVAITRLTGDVRHGGGELGQRRAEELGDQLLRRAAGEHVGKRGQAGGVVERQPHGEFARAARRGRRLAPVFQQLFETQLQYSARSPGRAF